MTDILKHWPNKNWKPRPGQERVLREAAASSWDVLVVVAPTGSGKTVLGNTILSWLGDGAYLTPTNMLVSQFRTEYPTWASLQRKDLYKCAPLKSNCSTVYKKKKKHCKGCPYVKDLRKIRVYPKKVLTYHMYMAHKLRSRNLVFDEAHNTLPVIRDLEARQLWQHEFPYPSSIKTVGELRSWVERCPGYAQGFPNDPKMGLLRAELDNAGDKRFLIEKTKDFWRGQHREVIKLLPLDISKAKPHLWAGSKKIVLMSATIGRKDVEALGLDSRRVKYVEAPSPIPADRRPVYVKPVGSLSRASLDDTLPKVAAAIREKASEFPRAKGLVHITYSMTDKLKPMLEGSRYIWHDGSNKQAQFRRWCAMSPDSGAILMAAGMHEGLDLIDDLGRWQIVAKIFWPSLEDTAIRYKAELDPEWYEWEAAKTLIQAAGRICRSPEDFGETTILDSSFFRIRDELFPRFFKDALR